MDVYSHLLAERIIYLGTGIDAGVANALIAQLLHLEADSPGQEIQLYINCEGGDETAMLAIYDTMQFIQAPVATTCVGQAIAAGAVLLAAGEPGRRSVLPHSRVVLHQPAAQGRGAIPDLILQADEVVRIRAAIESILSTAHRADRRGAAGRHRPRPGLRCGGGDRVRAGRRGARSGVRPPRPPRRPAARAWPDACGVPIGVRAAQVAGRPARSGRPASPRGRRRRRRAPRSTGP